MEERLAAEATSVARDEPAWLPVLRPLLPTAKDLRPYLQRIDRTRVYSNFGPLALELEERIERHLALPSGSVTSASSGTAALVGAILGSAGRADRQRPCALIPSYTFVATAVAVEMCGYRPLLADVDSESWMLDPERVEAEVDLRCVGVVVPVAPYGRPVPQAPWLRFRERTGIEVAIDAAACFDRLDGDAETYVGPLPLALSFHATKCFGIGEGGATVGTDSEVVAAAARALNFGFEGNRDCGSASINGKLSEYHAAVGLSALDRWPRKRRLVDRVLHEYHRLGADRAWSARLVTSPEIGASYVLCQLATPADAARALAELARRRIDVRFWYGRGLHHHSFYADLSREGLEVTEHLGRTVLGLPASVDLADGEIQRVVDAIADSTNGAG